MDNEICIERYTNVKKNRNRHGGVVIIYNKEGIQYNEITNLAGSEVESVWENNSSHSVLCTGHHPPTMHSLSLCWIKSTTFILIMKM